PGLALLASLGREILAHIAKDLDHLLAIRANIFSAIAHDRLILLLLVECANLELERPLHCRKLLDRALRGLGESIRHGLFDPARHLIARQAQVMGRTGSALQKAYRAAEFAFQFLRGQS